MPTPFYPIGTPGQPWGAEERAAWLAQESVNTVKRSYKEEALDKLEALKEHFEVYQYGAVSQDPDRYPLFAVKSRGWAPGKPSALVTGGVHGYETSGVQGAILFLQTKAREYCDVFNILVVPCVAPWGYETIQRWSCKAVDPNRSFGVDNRTEESSALIALLASLGVDSWSCHVDLHETTDSDVSEFRPARTARDGGETYKKSIPDGFYLVADNKRLQPAWHKAMIDAVRQVTHIAPAEADGMIIGMPLEQEGVISCDACALGLCASATNAKYVVTTEVYPDSPAATADICNRAQVACVTSALDFIIEKEQLVCNSPEQKRHKSS